MRARSPAGSVLMRIGLTQYSWSRVVARVQACGVRARYSGGGVTQHYAAALAVMTFGTLESRI